MYQHYKINKKSLYQFNQVIIIMRVYIACSKLVITEPKTFYFQFNLHKDVDKNLKHEIDIIERNSFLEIKKNKE